MARKCFSAAVYWMFIKDEQILLQRRSATNPYMPGRRSFPSWHLEWWETLKQWLIRELKEELWIDTLEQNLELVVNVHYIAEINYNTEYFDYFFVVKDYQWEIQNLEENKTDKLQWFDLENLPFEDMVPEVECAIKNYFEWNIFVELKV